MKELIIALWVVFPAIFIFLVLWALHDPTVKKEWGRIVAITYTLTLFVAIYAGIYPNIQQKIEDYFAPPEPEPVASASHVPRALRSQTVPRGAHNQWIGRNPSNIYESRGQ
uniref:Uncharacterized protein n=1 Tax=Pseudomonas phage HRDY3 TaxID=3236930 RepID=A0AB39CER5_9VIRU